MNLIVYLIIFVGGLLLGTLLTYRLLKERAKGWLEKWKTEHEKEIRKDSVKKSRSTIKGKIGEQIAPFLSKFEYNPSEARFIGSPVDYIIFEGHSEDNPKGVTFVDIKIGKTARLTSSQRALKKAIENGNVSWETIHFEKFDR